MLKPSLQLKLGQSLTMTPQLQQAIRLLQLPILDLNAQIQDALEENIMLEMEDLPDVPRTSGESTVEIETIKAEDSWQSSSVERMQDGGWNGDGRPNNDFADESEKTLREHLLWQLEMEHFTPREAVIGEALVDALGEIGQLGVIEPHQMKDGGMQVRHVPGVLDGPNTQLGSRSDRLPASYAGTREPHAEAEPVVIAARLL